MAKDVTHTTTEGIKKQQCHQPPPVSHCRLGPRWGPRWARKIFACKSSAVKFKRIGTSCAPCTYPSVIEVLHRV